MGGRVVRECSRAQTRVVGHTGPPCGRRTRVFGRLTGLPSWSRMLSLPRVGGVVVPLRMRTYVGWLLKRIRAIRLA